MRTTLTLEDDVATKLRDEMSRTGATLKQVVNDNLRRGFASPSEDELATPFVVKARPMGQRPGIDLDDTSGLIDFLDGLARR